MAHVRPDAKLPKHRISACKKGRHKYGVAQYVGAEIVRQVCETCGAVSIDLTGIDDARDAPAVNNHPTLESNTSNSRSDEES